MKCDRSGPSNEPAHPPRRSQPAPRRRILVADDDPALREVTAKVLIRHGFVADAAADGAAAWRVLVAGHYDLLVTDHEMPEVSGLQLLEQLPGARMALPVILASGAMPVKELQHQPSLNIEAALVKPYSAEELLGTVREVLHRVPEIRAPDPLASTQPDPVTAEGRPL